MFVGGVGFVMFVILEYFLFFLLSFFVSLEFLLFCFIVSDIIVIFFVIIVSLLLFFILILLYFVFVLVLFGDVVMVLDVVMVMVSELVFLSFILYIGDCGWVCVGIWLFLLLGSGVLIFIGICLGMGIIVDIIDKGWRGGGIDILLYVIGCKGGGRGSVVKGMGCIWISGVFLVICVIFSGRCGILCCRLFIFGCIDIMIGIWLIFGIIGCWLVM